MARPKTELVHYSIKTRLGYSKDTPDKDFWKDWNERTTKVCKPCWELKYCPYGKLVDLSPLLPISREEASDDRERVRELIQAGVLGRISELDDEEKAELELAAAEMEQDPVAFALTMQNRLAVDALIQAAVDAGEVDPISAVMDNNTPIQFYRTAFPIESDEDFQERLQEAYTPEVEEAIKNKIAQLRRWLETGVRDDSRPLEGWRKAIFEKRVRNFDPDDYPETQPVRIYECKCNIFGHVCPVFFTANAVTETSDERRRGRYLSFQTKLRVVRRDNYTCQHCGKHLLDTEVEFDHVIPIAKGGSSEEANIRLTCFDCNRSKSDRVDL